MFGGGGFNNRKMQQMMNQMGIDMTDIDAEEVIIRTADEELVFHNADVQLMEAQGQKTYQVVGDPDIRPRGESEASESADETETESESTDASAGGIPDADVEIVAQRTGVTEDRAREALEETDGDLAAAVEKLE